MPQLNAFAFTATPRNAAAHRQAPQALEKRIRRAPHMQDHRQAGLAGQGQLRQGGRGGQEQGVAPSKPFARVFCGHSTTHSLH